MSAISAAIRPVISDLILPETVNLALSLDVQLAVFFASGVKGIWRESRKAGTLFVEHTGITPVSPGSVAGLVMSLDQGGGRGPELVTNPSINGVPVGGPSFTTYATGASVVASRWYAVEYTVSGYAGSGSIGLAGSVLPDQVVAFGNGLVGFKAKAASSGAVELFTRGTNTATFTGISVKQLLGNHQSQATAGLRPLYQTGPQRLVFDGVDDVLNTTFPAALGATCTVGRAIPGTGAVISTNVNIGTSFADNVTASALLIADRALTAGETALWTAYLNQQSST